MKENLFYDLLSLKLSGDATKDQLLQLEQLMLAYPEWRIIHDEMVKPGYLYTEAAVSQAYAAHSAKMQIAGKLTDNDDLTTYSIFGVAKRKPLLKRVWPYASAAAVLLFAIAVYWVTQVQKTVPHSNEITTKKGSRSSVILPDGTQVWLNVDSKISYNNNFGERLREVQLIGEAYFDVAHDKQHPFIIHTSNANIKVLGTAFNVRNYPSDKAVEATLIRGKIEVTLNARPDNIIVLKPLEKIIIQKVDSAHVQNAASVASNSTDIIDNKVILTSVSYNKRDSLIAETGWLDDKMVFINQSLESIAKELERKFNVSIVFKTQQPKSYHYTGVFHTESISEILYIFKLSKKFNYKIIDKKIIIE